jgi:hypothetical protein
MTSRVIEEWLKPLLNDSERSPARRNRCMMRGHGMDQSLPGIASREALMVKVSSGISSLSTESR